MPTRQTLPPRPRQKSTSAVAPELEQVGGVEFALFTPQFFLLVSAALAGAQSFQYFPLPISAVVFLGCALPCEFEPAQLGLEFLPQPVQVLAEERRKLELGCAASGTERSMIGPGGIGEELLESGQRFLRARNFEASLAQTQRLLPLDALAQTQQRSESETERHRVSGCERHQPLKGVFHHNPFLRGLHQEVAQSRHERNGTVQFRIAVFLVRPDPDQLLGSPIDRQ